MRPGDTLVVRVNVVLRVVLCALAGLCFCDGVLAAGMEVAKAESWTRALDGAAVAIPFFVIAEMWVAGVWVTSVVINGQRGQADRMFGFPVHVEPLDGGEP
jgi:hypothetical protein